MKSALSFSSILTLRTILAPALLPLLLLALAPQAVAEESGFRTFTSSNGQTIEARLVAATATDATIVREDGKEFTFPLNRLSAKDQEYIKNQEPPAAPPAPPASVDSDVSLESINKAIGHELFVDGDLWSNPSEETSARLKWRRESETSYADSFRAYPNPEYHFFGARPYSAVLYGRGGDTESISIVYANKGDFFGAAGEGEEHFNRNGEKLPEPDSLTDAMERDVAFIEDSLTEVLGEPEKQSFGEGEAKRRVLRWDWSGHAFLLSAVDEEFVSVAIEPVAFADQKGRVKRTSETGDRQRARDSVQRNENGDVVITDIPMVNQGPKGYCVPATAERCMRHLGMQADMYLLAMAGNTGLGGGTSVMQLLTNIGYDIKRKGKKFDSFHDDEIEIRKLARYIDDGVPVMWTLFSTEDFNKTANERTKQRKEIADWTAWTQRMETVNDSPAIARQEVNAHCAMIIGYNKDTEEIAFSDSWGERYRERWITVAEASRINQGYFYVIDF